MLELHLELPSPSGDFPPSITHDLWQQAERAQSGICGGWEADAKDAVDRMVQHLLRLASKADWFFSDADHRALAIEETVIFNALGWTVSSQEAQDAFRPLWRRDTPRELEDFAELEEQDRLLFLAQSFIPRFGGALERDWLQAWKRWLRDC